MLKTVLLREWVKPQIFLHFSTSALLHVLFDFLLIYFFYV